MSEAESAECCFSRNMLVKYFERINSYVLIKQIEEFGSVTSRPFRKLRQIEQPPDQPTDTTIFFLAQFWSCEPAVPGDPAVH